MKALGNSVVPQCAEWIGRCVMEAAGRPTSPVAPRGATL